MRNINHLKIIKSMLRMVMVTLVLMPTSAMAVGVLGEYSFLHVTFDSVWRLFLFIFMLVMIPFVLIIFMSWRFRGLKEDEAKDHAAVKTTLREEQEE